MLMLSIYKEDLLLNKPTMRDLNRSLECLCGVVVVKDALVGHDEHRRVIISIGPSGDGLPLSDLTIRPVVLKLLDLL